MMLVNNPKSIYLSPEVWDAYHSLAKLTGSYPERGGKDAKPSVSALLRRIGSDPKLLTAIETWLNAPRFRPSLDSGAIIVRPHRPVTETVCWLSISGNLLVACFPEKHDEFRAIVKSKYLRWHETQWVREMSPLAGDPAHRLAELGHALLTEGFCCVFPDADTRILATTGKFVPEVRRHVLAFSKGEHKNWFALRWGYEQDCYDEAMKMTAAKYVKPYVAVPPEHVNEVRDFALINRFQFTGAALRLAELADAWRQSSLTTAIADLPSAEVDHAGLVEWDTPDADIDPELADDL